MLGIGFVSRSNLIFTAPLVSFMSSSGISLTYMSQHKLVNPKTISAVSTGYLLTKRAATGITISADTPTPTAPEKF